MNKIEIYFKYVLINVYMEDWMEQLLITNITFKRYFDSTVGKAN